MASSAESVSYCVSFVGHASLLALIVIFALVQGCFAPKQEEIFPCEFVIVTDENTMPAALAPDPEPAEPEPEPRLAEPEVIPDPPKPEPEPRPAEPEVVPDPPKPIDPPKPPPVKKPFQKGKRVEQKIVTPDADPAKFDKTKAATQKALSPEEIAKYLGMGAKGGATENKIPPNEASLYRAAILNAFEAAMLRQGVRASDVGKPLLKVIFEPSGSVRSCTLARSSGDAAYDAEVMKAAKTVLRVNGITVAYLSENPVATIQIELN